MSRCPDDNDDRFALSQSTSWANSSQHFNIEMLPLSLYSPDLAPSYFIHVLDSYNKTLLIVNHFDCDEVKKYVITGLARKQGCSILKVFCRSSRRVIIQLINKKGTMRNFSLLCHFLHSQVKDVQPIIDL